MILNNMLIISVEEYVLSIGVCHTIELYTMMLYKTSYFNSFIQFHSWKILSHLTYRHIGQS